MKTKDVKIEDENTEEIFIAAISIEDWYIGFYQMEEREYWFQGVAYPNRQGVLDSLRLITGVTRIKVFKFKLPVRNFPEGIER